MLRAYDFYASHYELTFRLQTGGTMLAAELALEHGSAINIGGGFHHACGDRGGGFCVYADITLAIRSLLDAGRIQRALIVDLDAHQVDSEDMQISVHEIVPFRATVTSATLPAMIA